MQRYVGFLLGAILLLEVGVAIIDRTVTGEQGSASSEAVGLVGGNTQALGRTLYTQYLFPFEVVSLVLTVGVIGAIVLAMPERLGEKIGARRGTISLGHPRGMDGAPLPLPSGTAAARQSPQGEMRGGIMIVKDAESYTETTAFEYEFATLVPQPGERRPLGERA